MITTVRAEATKFGTVRTLPWLAAAAVLGAVATGALFLVSLPITQGATLAELTTGEVLGAALLGVDVAAIVLVVAAATFAGSEYATGLAQPTFLLTPRRGRVVGAKAVVTAVVATAVAVLSAVLCVGVAQAALGLTGAAAAPVDLRFVAGAALTPVFYALVALAAAFLARSTGGGIVAALALLAAPTVLGWIPGLALLVPALPAAALHTLAGNGEDIGVGAAVASLAAWLGLLGSLTLWRVRHRDV